MGSYNLSLFFHVLFALWLTAGVFGSTIVRAQTRKAKDFAAKAFGYRLAWRSMAVFTIPGALLAGLLGLYLVGAHPWSFAFAWVKVSTILYFAMLALTLGYLAPISKRTARAAEESLAAGGPTPEFTRLIANKLPGIFADVNALGIVVLVFLMVLKPV
ncbi:MAG TPA: DUF2269 family protein [Thermoanaerobaculia bacterium]|nr:DUF2269 family protein [Thermoanaerobaculia bacterium]